jgi:hypothetical protein
MRRCACSTLCLLLLVAGVCVGPGAQEIQKASALPEIFAVSTVAYHDFEEQLSRAKRGDSETQRYIADIRNYEVTISAYEDLYFVTFKLKPFHGTEFFGGVERYTVNRKTGAIIERTGEK